MVTGWFVGCLGSWLVASGSAPQTETATLAAPLAASAPVDPPHPEDWTQRYERMEPPEVDGRPPAPPTAAEVLVWVPRVIFSPVYLVTEYVIRRPVGALATWVEKESIPTLLFDLFTFGEERQAGFVPTAFFDFAFRPSIGIYAFANDVGVQGHELRLTAAFGGVDWYKTFLFSRWELRPGTRLSFGFRFLKRPDYIFHGLGPLTQRDDRTRYERRFVGGEVGLQQALWGLGELSYTAQVEENVFQPGDTAFNDPSLQSGLRLGFFEPPSGLEGYFLLRNQIHLRLDSRRDLRESGTGVSVSGSTEFSFDLNDPARRRWVRVGGGLGGHLDVGHNRILSLAGYVERVFDGGELPVPFTELPRSAESVLFLSGFQEGRLTGGSMVAAAFEYRYDVWALVDGRAFVSVGNVFSRDFGDFSVDRLRLNYGIGFASVTDPDVSFNFLIAFGHETFSEGSDLDSVRFVVGFQPDL